MLGALFITSYTAVVRPYEDPIMNYQEIVNEVAVCFCTYMLFAYTEIITDMEHLVVCGWVNIGLCAGIVLINLLFMSYISCCTLLLRCKKCKI
mmetsp:Transcript_38644/g.50659  ORF Transcript_38644/g.50659 Transcript_38644/m.50659 type:complete len:93 (+) Transcript_38644:557-835(+)